MECERAGLPIPEYKYAFSGLMIEFYLLKVGEKVGEKLTDNEKEIVNLIKKNPHISARELSLHIGISSRKVEENIRKLKNKKIVCRYGTPRTGHWEVY